MDAYCQVVQEHRDGDPSSHRMLGNLAVHRGSAASARSRAPASFRSASMLEQRVRLTWWQQQTGHMCRSASLSTATIGFVSRDNSLGQEQGLLRRSCPTRHQAGVTNSSGSVCILAPC